jgi:parallel beta-helix repeat protein
VFRRNDVTNNHTAICFNLGHSTYGEANGTIIESNRIHHCGVLPAANHDHGIYVSRASNTVIRGNWIYENADRGIQLYPNAQNTTVTANVIDSNGQGIIFGGLGTDSSDHNRIEGNVITNSKLRYNVESYYDTGTPPGEDNPVTHNCISGGVRDSANGGIATPNIGFTATANLTTAPAFVNRAAGDYRLAAGNPCRGLIAQPNLVPGPDPTAEHHTGPPLVLKVRKNKVRQFARVSMRGKLRTGVAPGVPVAVMVRTSRGSWRQLAQTRARRNGRFHLNPRLRVGHGSRIVRLRAQVRGVGRSQSVRVRVRARNA